MVVDIIGAQLVVAIDGLKNQIKESIGFADNAQRASLALGLTYSQSSNKLDSTMQGLRGSLTEKFQASIAGMEAGLQGNTAGVARLINQQMLTGTASRNTAEALAGVEAGLNLNRDSTNMLASELITTGNRYEISTDKLLASVTALQSTFPAQALAGMGDKVVAAVTLLQAQLGPQLKVPLTSAMRLILDPSIQAYERLTLLGIGDVRERLSASRSQSEATQILKEAMVTASNSFKTISKGADKSFFKVGIAADVFGREAINFTTIAQSFGDRVASENKDSVDFGLTLRNLKNEILAPFHDSLSKFHPILVKSFDGISAMGNLLSKKFGDFLEKQLPSAEKAFDFLTFAIMDGTLWLARGLDNIVINVKETFKAYWPVVKDQFLEFASALNTTAKTLLKVSNAFLDEDEINKRLAGKHGVSYASMVFGDERSDGSISFHVREWVKKQEAGLSFGSRTSEASKALSEGIAKAVQSAWVTDLEKFIKNQKDGLDLVREQNESLNSIDSKTPELVTTTPEFLDRTVFMLGKSIENILGVGRNTTAEEMLEELRIANEQRSLQSLQGGSSTFTPLRS